MNDNRIARAYDALAADYDAQLEANPLARAMRRQLHAQFARIFRAGERVLDFTAGTGSDACFLAARGVHVTALDVSSGMIAKLNARAASLGLQVDARVFAAERLDELAAAEFDGALSTFAGLNTIDALPRLAQALSGRVKPRGRVVIHALNAFCFWEWLSRRARRGDFRVGDRLLPHQCFNPYVLWRETFAPYFQLRQVYGQSVVVSPTRVKRFPRAEFALLALDRVAGRLLPAAGDFFVMELERR